MWRDLSGFTRCVWSCVLHVNAITDRYRERLHRSSKAHRPLCGLPGLSSPGVPLLPISLPFSRMPHNWSHPRWRPLLLSGASCIWDNPHCCRHQQCGPPCCCWVLHGVDVPRFICCVNTTLASSFRKLQIKPVQTFIFKFCVNTSGLISDG